MMKKLLLAIIGLLIAAPALAAVTISTTNPPYGWQVMTGSQRTVAVYPAGGATNKVNWSISSGGSILANDGSAGCTSNCVPVATVKITATGGTCSVTGSVGSYVLHSTVDVTLTATSVDDGTKTATIPFHVCDTTSSAFVDVEPSYNQAFKGQKKTLQSYVIGIPANENVTWSILSQPSGGNGTFTDTTNRDTLFSATVTGRYTLKATSVANGSLSGTAIIYVSPNNMPSYATTPNKTEPTECYVDPALTGTDYEVGPGFAYTTLKSLGTVGWNTGAGNIVRIHNIGTSGTSPTTFHEVMQIQGMGTPTQPIIFCGVPDALGDLPVIDGSNATEDPADSPYLEGAGAFKFVYTNSQFNYGYELPSTGPDYVNITGIRIQNLNANYSYYPNGSSTLQPYTGGAGVYTRAGQHVHFEGLDMNNVGWGWIDNNNTAGTGTSITMFHQFMGGHINNFSDTNSYSEHALYIEALYSLVEGNLIENPVASDSGDYIKMRGGNSIIRYNTFRGTLWNHVVEYPDMEDTFQFMSAADNLGTPGDTNCSNSVWCYQTSNNITLPHLTENGEALAKDYIYGNVMASNPTVYFGETIQYGSYSAPEECPPCTNMSDRQGRLYFWNNTVDKPLAAVFMTANYYTGGYTAMPQYSFTTIAAYNNVMFGSTVNPFVMNIDTTEIANWQTNMFKTGTVSITTPITGGTSTGWGGYTGPYAFPLSNPMQTHMTGVTSGNFLSTATQPYNSTTFIPISGSPLIGAGGSITDPEISAMPVRFQPNATNGFVTARTGGASTIGAEENSSSPTLVSMALTPTSLSLVVGGATQTLTCTATMSDSTTPACSTVGTVTWLSGTPSHATVNSSGVVSPVAAGTSNITASIGAVTSNTVVATVVAGFNVNNTMSQATIQSIMNSADATTGNTVTFAGGNYTGWTGLTVPCVNGTIYTGPVGSAGFAPGTNNQWVQQTAGTPAVLNSDNNVSGSGSIFTISGGNSGHTTPGSGCTIQYLTFDNDGAIVAGGDWASNSPSYGILFQNNTIENLTNNGNGSTGLFFHNVTGYTIQNNYVTAAAYSGTGGFGIAQSDTNGLITNNFCGTIGQCFGSGFDGATGFTNIIITNNICKDIARICIEFTNGNSPGIATGLQFKGNLYIAPAGDPNLSPFSGAVSMATGNFSNPGSSGFTYQITDNVFAANTSFNTSGGNHMFYCAELTSGSASTFLRNLCQGFWPAAPAVAVGNVTGALDISNTIAQGSFLTSSGAAIGCEYSGTLPNCGFSSGGTIPGPITFGSLTTGTTPIQQVSTAPSVSPAAGAFASPPTFTISNTQPNVSHFYTTNGTTPTTASTLYTGPVACSSLPCTVNVISQWGQGAATAYPFPSPYGWAPSSVTSVTYIPIGGTAASPTCAPPSGAYSSAQTVTCASTTPSSTTYCTINGTTPTTSSPVCTGISVSSTLTLKAISAASGMTNSSVVSVPYTITIPATVVSILVSPSTAAILTTGTQSFVCTATMSDSSTRACSSVGTTTWTSASPSVAPVSSSGLASGVSAGSTTIQASIPGVTPSTATLNVSAPVVGNPTCTPPQGAYSTGQTVSCSSVTSGSTTYCTIDGTTPTSSSPVCTAIAVTTSLTLKAISEKTGSTNSTVMPQVYTITPSTGKTTITNLTIQGGTFQ